jgi:serine/threonine-protein kinase
VERELGRGGFGAVVLARHDVTGTRVAIKYLLPGGGGRDPESVAMATRMFFDEAKTLTALDDPHVVRLYEYFQSTAGAAIVMELVDGPTLGDMLARFGKTSPAAALAILYGSLLGLAAAHARGVVHRDYKPANVLVNANGASKLTDFGIAAWAGDRTGLSGTLPYMPPEQFEGTPASPAGDVYAATATFYQCLTGHVPFAGKTVTELHEKHKYAEVPMDPVPEPLRPIVARGMAKDPQYRPSDAAALALALRTVAASAYGPQWEQHGRSQLGEAAVLLAALWPAAGLPALQGSAVEQVHLTQAAQHAHAAQAARHVPTRAARHSWHLRHVLHLEHLARTATVAVTATAVVAAAATVAYTARAPGGPGGTPAHPAVAAYQAPLAPALPATLTSINSPINGDTYVEYGLSTTTPGEATLSGEIPNVTAGEVARLYAQQFPYTSAPVLVQNVPLDPSGGTGAAKYSVLVSPTLATRYQVELFRSTAATTPLATTAVKTVYVADYAQLGGPQKAPAGCSTCAATFHVTVSAPSSAIAAEMAKRVYLYTGDTAPGGRSESNAPMRLDAAGTASAPQRTSANTYTMVLEYTTSVGFYIVGATYTFCVKPTEAQDGIGLPGPSTCGAATIPITDFYGVSGY